MLEWTSPPHQATAATASLPKSYLIASGYTFVSASAFATLERGIRVSHEAIRLWTLKFGAEYARRLRRRIGRYGDTWHLDEVFCKSWCISGAPWIRKGRPSMSWCRSGATPKQRNVSSESY
jgi:hypothetical protein